MATPACQEALTSRQPRDCPGGYFTAVLLRWRHGDKTHSHGRGTSAQGTTPPHVPQIRLYQQWLHATRGLQFDSYDALWRFLVGHRSGRLLAKRVDYFDLQSPTPHTGVLAKTPCLGRSGFRAPR